MIRPLIKGLGVTLRYFLDPRKVVTMQYPDERWTPSPRFRGLHEQLRDGNDNEKCVACGLCAKVCPADCIHIESMEDETGRRRAKSYEIEILRCIFCGYCEEACPVGAIHLGQHYELSAPRLEDHIYTMERLLVTKRYKGGLD